MSTSYIKSLLRSGASDVVNSCWSSTNLSSLKGNRFSMSTDYAVSRMSLPGQVV